MRFTKTVVPCLSFLVVTAGAAVAQEPPDQQSKMSSPFRPAGIDPAYAVPAKTQVTIPGVPAYRWRHGCGPTSVAMVVGYWDAQGLDDLIPGDASTQSDAVEQAIASGGDFFYPSNDAPWPAGLERHFEDYARPVETGSQLLPDAYIAAGRTPHPDDCIADFMKTSRSTVGNYYGWSWSSDVRPAFRDYVASVSSLYLAPAVTTYQMGASLTFDVLKTQVDSGRPMVFLVDSSGDGGTDHFVTVIGYDDSSPADPRYLFFDTWDSRVHSATFQSNMPGRQWGVWAGWAFNIADNRPRIVGNLRIETNEPLELTTVGAFEGASYQWETGPTPETTSPLPGETSDTYTVDFATVDHAGWYRCRVSDGAKSDAYTAAVQVEVFEHMPAAGLGALAAGLLAITALAGWRNKLN